jgi:general stress protein YciG
VTKAPESVVEFLREAGRKGGSKTSPAKAAASRANAKKAREKRWAGKAWREPKQL